MSDDPSLRLYATDIERELDAAPSDLRALRRIVRADLGILPGRVTAAGRQPNTFALNRVLAWLASIGDILTPEAELGLRESAFRLGGAA